MSEPMKSHDQMLAISNRSSLPSKNTSEIIRREWEIKEGTTTPVVSTFTIGSGCHHEKGEAEIDRISTSQEIVSPVR